MNRRIFFIFLTICPLVVVSGCVTVRMSTGGGNPGDKFESASSLHLAPTQAYRDVNIPKDVVDNLPKDHALSFLQSLNGPDWWSNSCRFNSEGVTRSAKGGALPGKQSYSALNTSFAKSGNVEIIAVFVNKTKEVWCLIDPRSIAQHKGTPIDSLTSKIFTSLLSMGVIITPSGISY